MIRVALLGAKGYIGSSLYKNLVKNKNYATIPVVRETYQKFKRDRYDIVINAAMPSARFWAENHPLEDFRETVTKTADIVYGWKFEKMIQISSISVRSDKNSIYSKHKSLAESLCNKNRDLIIRLTATFDKSLKKGVLLDIIKERRVFVDIQSRYSFASLDFVTSWIASHLSLSGIVEVGAKNSISIKDIADQLGISVKFGEKRDIQVVKNPVDEYPDAKLVINFMRGMLSLQTNGKL